ncbi:MAG: TolC family protein [Sulfurimonas sp.]|nr:TolC family protein [Sulfurimonas sp.]
MKYIYTLLYILIIFNSSIMSASTSINLDEAIKILKSDNLEIKSAIYDVKNANENINIALGNHFGKLDFIQDFINSDDAGNVFGFKLTSREANFDDFGADEYIPNQSVQPNALNYPNSRNFFQSKLKYEVPLFSGFKISSYVEIMKSISKIKKLEKYQIINEKIYQVKKSFYDMALLRTSTENLNKILNNINTLEEMTQSMIEIGYAKKVDLLEVKAKKGNVQRLISQMKSNQKLLYHYIGFLLNQEINNIKVPSSDIQLSVYSTNEILDSNLNIKKANYALEIKKNMIKASQATYYPMIGAFAELQTADDTFLGDANDHLSYTLGARLTWNIFNGSIDSSNIEKSRLEYLKMKTQVQLAKSGTHLKIQKIKTEIETFDNDIKSLQQELILADEIYKNYEGRYREKLSSMSDVIIKQSEQIQKILQIQEVKNKRNERIFALEKLANGEEQ